MSGKECICLLLINYLYRMDTYKKKPETFKRHSSKDKILDINEETEIISKRNLHFFLSV